MSTIKDAPGIVRSTDQTRTSVAPNNKAKNPCQRKRKCTAKATVPSKKEHREEKKTKRKEKKEKKLLQ